MIIAICISLIIGMNIGRFFREPYERCPARIKGFDCTGLSCDHTKSEFYRAKMQMALIAEEREDKNYWKGNDENM